MFYLRVIQALHKRHLPHALVGGLAVALHGAVRGTVDLDLVIRIHSKRDFSELEAALNELGLDSRLPVSASEVFEFREEYIKRRNLIAWSFLNPKRPSEVVDVILTHDRDQMKVKKFKVQGVEVPVASIPDLIEMKKSAGRPQDLEDVRALEEILKR